MRKYNETRNRTFLNTADLTGKAGYVMAYDTSNVEQVVVANAQTLPICGILLVENQQTLTKSRVTVVTGSLGTVQGVYGGTISIGDWLTADTAGKLITTTTNKDHVVARALEAGSTGEIHPVEK